MGFTHATAWSRLAGACSPDSKTGQDDRFAVVHAATMDSAGPPSPDLLATVVRWIEQNLDGALTVELIADRAGLSPYHFSRLFSARMGRGVMAHVRGRRLVRAGRRLLEQPESRLIDLAFDAGFESQEAFTRAFGRVFGVTPSRFRQGFAVSPMEGQYPMDMPPAGPVKVARQSELADRADFVVAGPARRFDEATKSNIPQLWSKLIGALPFPGCHPSWATYGVVWDVDRGEGSFDYMAGVEVEPEAVLPLGFATKLIPAARYAVFRITLNGGPLHPQIRAAMATIWGDLIPSSGLRVRDQPDFELYDGRFAPNRAGAVIDFHVPVVA